ncbi:unnamed protein product [Ilex paraguariensis]|uniref:Non-specific lipid-transfer protein n=1 Tax=Ilex paraguariensis TaxID=185542 RepID=A0ABC8RI52_9AQUA
MASSGIVKLACVVLMCMVVAAPYGEAAISCGTVASDLAPCISYLRGIGGQVPPRCCTGVQSLYRAATTTADRQQACNCMKAAAGSVKDINLSLAAGLPAKCNVNIPYKISPSTDCAKVQ